MATRTDSRSSRTSESNLFRTSLVIACLVGCMRIYPDPDLPDVRVDWYADDSCRAPGDTVVTSLATGDPITEIRSAAAPCRDAIMTLADVPRERYVATVTLVDDTGNPIANQLQDIDLHDGYSERISVFFPGALSSFVRGTFAFDMGATCASLGASLILLNFYADGNEFPIFSVGQDCTQPAFMLEASLAGTFSVTARALDRLDVVAVSPPVQVTIAPAQIVDLGTIVLSPCGDACPAL